MFKNQEPEKKNNITEKKIPWYRRRWFWGVVILTTITITASFYYKTPQNNLSSIIDLLAGIFWVVPSGIAVIILAITGVDSSVWPIFLLIFKILYLLLLIFLLYQTFRRPNVKVIYVILLITVFLVSAFFGILAGSFA
ncbi:hypothetical protein KAU19_02905 [Candidatus Parcubacteria bacterium]|nr:hypothetical protein [Candidatus Parcubacteria bacterium]